MTDDDAGYVGSVPRSREENRRLVELRPPAWEYMVYAGALLEGVQALDRQYRAPEARTTHRQGEALSATEALPFVSRQMAALSAIYSRIDGERLLDPRAADAAFGPPGESGEVEAIRALAAGPVAVYEDMLKWAAEMREITVPPEFEEVFSLVAGMADRPTAEMRAFIDRLVMQIDSIPARLQTGQPVEITARLTLTGSPELTERYLAAVARVEATLPRPAAASRRQSGGLSWGFIFRLRKGIGGGRTVNLSKRGASVSQRVGPLTLNSRGGGRIRIARGLSFRFGKRR